MQWEISHTDSDDRCFDAELFLEPRRRYDRFHYGLSHGNHELYRAGDGWEYRMHQLGQRHGDGQSAAERDGQFGDDLSGRLSQSDGDDWRIDAKLFVESGRRYHRFHHGLSDDDHDL